jgi:hypothetical protein
MKRLNGVDALMLYSETPEVHMHTLKIGILDVSCVDGFSFEMFRRVAYPRLMALTPLRYQLVDIPRCGRKTMTSTSTITCTESGCPHRVVAENSMR